MNELIKSIIDRRNYLGWTRKMLADRTDIPLSAVSRIEKGIGQWEDYISTIDNVLSEEINKTTYFSEIKLKEEEKEKKNDHWK
jgi:predicted transcriptional regulator